MSEKILWLIKDNPEMSAKELAYIVNRSSRTMEAGCDICRISRRKGQSYGIAKCDTFKAASAQQVVSQLTQIPWGQNITKNLPDEFRSSLPSIEAIEAELSGVEES